MDTPTPRPSPVITPEPAGPEGEAEEETAEHSETIDEPATGDERTQALISGVAVLVGALGLALFLRRN
jgi:LPXTG-motif cell wall-anchored protein